MSKLYGWELFSNNISALFKITHFKGANVIYFECVRNQLSSSSQLLSLFYVEYNWALVYPELAVGDAGIEPKKIRKN